MKVARKQEVPLIPLVTAAARLKISWDRCWRLVITGVLKGEKIQNHWYVDPRTVQALLRRQEAEDHIPVQT